MRLKLIIKTKKLDVYKLFFFKYTKFSPGYSLLCPSRKILLRFKSLRIDLNNLVLLYFDIRQFHRLQPIRSGCFFPFVETISAQICVIKTLVSMPLLMKPQFKKNNNNGKLLHATRIRDRLKCLS